jgi:lipid-binding SYLF domain-containing protein
MQRRTLILTAAVGAAVFAGCTTNTGPSTSAADKKATIDKGVVTTMETLYSSVKGSRELASKAAGILVFPSVFSAGLVVGGEYGEGALQVGGSTVGYYKTTSGSFGFQAGVQSRALIMMFMTQDALNKFRASSGWTAGADATVSLVKMGANGMVDTASAGATVNAFALTNSGLMAGVSIDGSKVSKLDL